MKEYKLKRARQEKTGRAVGLALTVCAHLALVVFGVFNGLIYLYPPPEEQTFLIDFSEEVDVPVQIRAGNVPKSEETDRTKPIELVQKSEAQYVGHKANETPESMVDDFGDVEVKQPEREKEIDRRALFHTADNKTDKDTMAAQTAEKVSESLKAGHAAGNTSVGKTDGQPNADLKRRSTVGVLPKPQYSIQEEGTVVVTIWVDQYGTVQRAVAGADGTTVTNSKLWQAARDAALKAHFNQSADAPTLQQGTITYKFRLK